METETDIDPITMLGPELSEAEERALLDHEVRSSLNMSLADFERRWHAGEFRDQEDPRITSIGMLLH